MNIAVIRLRRRYTSYFEISFFSEECVIVSVLVTIKCTGKYLPVYVRVRVGLMVQ